MSEKRIFVFEVDVNCRNLRFGRDINEKTVLYCASDTSKDWKDITEKDCKNCKKARYLGITREQAIRKIAKAICRTDGENCITCGFNCNEKGCREYLKFGNYITQAEEALNALLEAPNGK